MKNYASSLLSSATTRPRRSTNDPFNVLQCCGGLSIVVDEGVDKSRARYYDTEFHTDESEHYSCSSEMESLEDWRQIYPKKTPLYIPYPKSMAFIISNEFCERFNYYGIRTILVLYLTQKLGYNEEAATVLFHIFTMLVYIFPLFGALIADGWLGKYKTICYLSVVYSIGAMIVSFGAIPLKIMPTKWVTIVGLLLIAIGTGGIKPCVSAFGGDQFIIPRQRSQLAKFFSLFYFAINAGSMISTTVTPILRADVHCFGDDDCFSLAFGVPAMLMIISVVIFVAGRSYYKRSLASGNMIFGVSQCIIDAFKEWRKTRHENRSADFLDFAIPTVGHKIVFDTKRLAKILILYLPFPIFWALFDQQGSRWTFQATRLDGTLWGFNIKPDQMQVVNPLLILTFIPLFDYKIYPLLKRIGIEMPLQKLTIGGLLAALGFFISSALEMRIEMTMQSTAPGSEDISHLRLYNGMPCRYEFLTGEGETQVIDAMGLWSGPALYVNEPTESIFLAKSLEKSPQRCPGIKSKIKRQPGKAISYFIAQNQLYEFADSMDTARNINSPPLLRMLLNTPNNEGLVLLRNPDTVKQSIPLDSRNLSKIYRLTYGPNEIIINGRHAVQFEAQNGGLYNLLVQGSEKDGYQVNLLEMEPPTSISILWQLPQIVVMTAAEIMFSVTGLEFSFTQAPPSMKSVLQACWLLSVAIGNMIVVVMAEIKFANSQSAEFALFGSIMLVDMLLFFYLARNYEYVNPVDPAHYEPPFNLFKETRLERHKECVEKKKKEQELKA